jgi:hypothetical protein
LQQLWDILRVWPSSINVALVSSLFCEGTQALYRQKSPNGNHLGLQEFPAQGYLWCQESRNRLSLILRDSLPGEFCSQDQGTLIRYSFRTSFPCTNQDCICSAKGLIRNLPRMLLFPFLPQFFRQPTNPPYFCTHPLGSLIYIINLSG